ncbi:MAG: DUF192 domain-containing protein [Patescibacteria group bacterium]|jgi:uncharacterized membrane protein (UPF0127 family)|nr:DUF192 domain-containing protein [Patescibacteria group bacterium]
MKFKFLVPAVGGIIIIISFIIFTDKGFQTKPYLIINNLKVTVEISQDQTMGLANRVFLKENNGMLFAYPPKTDVTFWMKGMRFPLDFIWISNNKVIATTENIQPPTNNERPAVVNPPEPIDHVLEVNAGFVKKHQIKINDQVSYFLD